MEYDLLAALTFLFEILNFVLLVDFFDENSINVMCRRRWRWLGLPRWLETRCGLRHMLNHPRGAHDYRHLAFQVCIFLVIKESLFVLEKNVIKSLLSYNVTMSYEMLATIRS